MEYFNETTFIIFFFLYIKVSKIFEGNNFLLRTKGNFNFLFILFLFYSATNENQPRILKTKILTDEIKLQSTLLRNQYKIHNSLFPNEILIAIDKLFRIMIPISIHQRKIKIYPTNLSNKDLEGNRNEDRPRGTGPNQIIRKALDLSVERERLKQRKIN